MKRKSEICVIYKRPGFDPVEVTIPNTLEQLQGMVGGYIETVPFTREILLLCDEEGKLRNREPNFALRGDVIFGAVVFLGVKGDEFTDCPMDLETFYMLYDWLFDGVPS